MNKFFKILLKQCFLIVITYLIIRFQKNIVYFICTIIHIQVLENSFTYETILGTTITFFVEAMNSLANSLANLRKLVFSLDIYSESSGINSYTFKPKNSLYENEKINFEYEIDFLGKTLAFFVRVFKPKIELFFGCEKNSLSFQLDKNSEWTNSIKKNDTVKISTDDNGTFIEILFGNFRNNDKNKYHHKDSFSLTINPMIIRECDFHLESKLCTSRNNIIMKLIFSLVIIHFFKIIIPDFKILCKREG